MGALETKEDGTKVWNRFGNLKNRKLINFEDAQNSWWTGGIVGEFQTEHEENLRAKELATKVNESRKADRDKYFAEYFAKNMAQNQGVESQIRHINHQNASLVEYDEAVLNEDHYTAHNMKDDAIHSSIVSRIDAGMFDTIHAELVDPTKNQN